MCGIAGVIGYRANGRTHEAELLTLRDAQTHRGPDDPRKLDQEIAGILTIRKEAEDEEIAIQ